MTKFRFVLGVTLALATLSGCQKEAAPPTATSSPSSATPTESTGKIASNKLTQAEAFTQPMPEGVVLDFPYHARSVKTVESKKTGAKSQQFLLEYLAADAKTAADAVSADMARAGFTTAGSQEKRNGYNLSFTKNDMTVKAYVRKTSQKKLRHAEAQGLIKLSFPLQAPASQPAA